MKNPIGEVIDQQVTLYRAAQTAPCRLFEERVKKQKEKVIRLINAETRQTPVVARERIFEAIEAYVNQSLAMYMGLCGMAAILEGIAPSLHKPTIEV